MDKFRNFFSKPPEAVKLDPSAEVLDTLWGYYFASGSYGPISRILLMLPWSKDREDTERLTVGNMAKYTLASNAARDADLLAMLKRGLDRQPASRSSWRSSTRPRRWNSPTSARPRSPRSRT
jgi:hypothetical protein